MKVEQGWLIEGDVDHTRRSPTHSEGIEQKYLVIHYTAGASFESSVAWLCNPAARASAHLVIGRNGEVAQLVSFDRRAWHAGISQWQGLQFLNAYSIGIELDNEGLLTKRGDGTWVFGNRTVRIPDDQVVLAAHERDPAGVVRGWKAYTEAQIAKLLEVADALHATYGFEDVLGHDDISWPRKMDPGPAFPMRSLRGRLLGRE